jgi:serine/threonine-protein kinase
MATVHLGRLRGAAGFSRTVAIKRLPPLYAIDPEFKQLFIDEAHVAARIQHPNVATTLDVIGTKDELLLVLEYVHGETLAKLVRAMWKSHRPLRHDIIVSVLLDALYGLHAAHEARDRSGRPMGIVHQDISPQNIMVGADGVARVLDFGVARVTHSACTSGDRRVRGKVTYMAPEQLLGASVTRQTDIYAMGVVLWELLVGQRLFRGRVRPELASPNCLSVPDPREKVPHVPPLLAETAVCALQPDPAKRFQDASEMAGALELGWPAANRTEIGDWVKETAAGALAERDAFVSRLEALTASRAPAPQSEPPPGSQQAAHSSQTMFSFADGGQQINVQRRRRARMLALVGSGALVVVAAVASLALTGSSRATGAKLEPKNSSAAAIVGPGHQRGSARPQGPQRATAARASSGSASPAAALLKLDRAAALKLERSEDSEAAVQAPPAANSLAAPPRPRKRRQPTSRKPRSQRRLAAKAARCSPPYRTDSAGRRHYLAHCF